MKRPDGLVVVRNLTEGAKIKVDEVTEPIEPDLLYPLLRGRDVQRWHAEPSALILMVQDPIKRRGIDEKELQTRCPRAYGYLKRFEQVLRKRASRGISDMLKKGAPFYTMFAVGDYTFAPWKVVWPWISKGVRTAVVGLLNGKPVIPEHNVFLVECARRDEAFYICGLMNSSPGDFSVRSFFSTGGGGIGSPVVLEHVHIPRYDSKKTVHRRLAELSEKAHQAAKRDDTEELKKIEAEIDEQAAQLWGLNDAELREIQRSLQELEGEGGSIIGEDGNGG
jgi:hypothetical protein